MTARRVAWVVWAVTALLLAAAPVAAASGHTSGEPVDFVFMGAGTLAYATVGALITSRDPTNRIGLIFSAMALGFAVAVAAGASYAELAIDGGVSLPFAREAAWLGRVGFVSMLAPFPLLFLLYPTGHVASPRWRPVLVVMLVAIGINVVLFALTPGPISAGFAEFDTPVPNPFGLPSEWKGAVEAITQIAGLVVFIGAFLGLLSLILRYRRSLGDERQQIRWLMYVAGVVGAVFVLGIVIELTRELLGVQVSEDDPLGNILFAVASTVLLFGVPAACGIAILKYRLYDLDVVVKKTVLFGILIVLMMAVALALVLVASGPLTDLAPDETQAVGIAGLVVGALVWPLYRLSRRIADRVVFGGRATPGEVLSEFSERVGETYSTEDVLPRMAQLLGQATRARVARVWLRVGDELRPAAPWPDEAGRPPTALIAGDGLPDLGAAEEAFEVRHQGELLGALTVEMSPSDPMNPSKERIVHGLASQAGLVLRNVRLIEELRESRRRIVAAQDERAKKLERNIHDGAQQQLVALTVKLRLAEQIAGREPERAQAMLAELRAETTEALEDLRDLARGIYPPLLADQGLAAALEAQSRKSAVPATVDADGVGRYPEEVESAVYFSVLEALQNVAKYAGAERVNVRLSDGEAGLRFEVEDDGVGFDPSTSRAGTGLQGMADRLAAIGGRLDVASTPGSGTTVTGSIPTLETGP